MALGRRRTGELRLPTGRAGPSNCTLYIAAKTTVTPLSGSDFATRFLTRSQKSAEPLLAVSNKRCDSSIKIKVRPIERPLSCIMYCALPSTMSDFQSSFVVSLKCCSHPVPLIPEQLT